MRDLKRSSVTCKDVKGERAQVADYKLGKVKFGVPLSVSNRNLALRIGLTTFYLNTQGSRYASMEVITYARLAHHTGAQ